MLPQLRLVCQISMFPVLDEAFDWHTYCHQSPAGNEDGDGSNQEKIPTMCKLVVLQFSRLKFFD